MTSSASDWSIRGLLSPVITRLLIQGVHPIELERVVARIEAVPLRGPRDLENRWLEEWEALAQRWEARASEALAAGHRRTAAVMAVHGVGCRLAMFLINTSQMERKRQIYLAYARAYRAAAECFEPPARVVSVPFDGQRNMSAVLHLPPRSGVSRVPCVAIFAGLGSCKEEMQMLARAMVQRGIAALVPDMPGCGESLFEAGLTCNGPNIEASFHAVAEFVASQPELDSDRLGVCGLCMGGGYAYRAAAREPRYTFCATLFPLFIDQVSPEATPQWMRSGPWLRLQTGDTGAAELLQQLALRDDESVSCPYFLIHGRHDNWMTLERALLLHQRAREENRKLLVIDDEPLYSSGHAVTHTMPVGEQLHWVAPVVADWIADQTGVGAGATEVM